MTRALPDTNVILSGLLYRGPASKILTLAENNKVELLTTPELVREFINVLHRKKFEPRLLLMDVKPEVLALKYLTLAKVIPLDPTVSLQSYETLSDPSDNIVLMSALSTKANFLITGDKEVLRLRQLRTISIVPPSEFINTFSNFVP